jgi:hypothetical protein
MQARYCKGCGFQLVDPPFDPPARTEINLEQPIPVELTDKKWKSLMLKGRAIRAVAVLIWLVSLEMCTNAGGNQDAFNTSAWVWMFSIVLFLIGNYVERYAKQQAWWDRG